MGKFTDPLPLRRTTDWPSYGEDAVLPVVYGAVTLAPLRYQRDPLRYLLADHAIQGVDAVTLRGEPYSAWVLSQETDPTGHPAALLSVQHNADPGDWAVTLRGKQHPQSGALLDTPDLILWDVLANLAGLDLPYARLDDLRAWGSAVVPSGGVLSARDSVQSVLDQLTSGMGLAWSPACPGLALPWPPADPPAQPLHHLDDRTCPDLTAEADLADLATVLVLDYAWDWATGTPTASLRAEAPQAIERFGIRERRLSAGWIRQHGAAESYAQRWLGRHANPAWVMTGTAGDRDWTIGGTVTLQHRHCPATLAWVTSVTRSMTTAQLTLVSYPTALTQVLISRLSLATTQN